MQKSRQAIPESIIFGQLLRRLMSAYGIDRNYVAAACQCDPQTVTNYLGGRADMPHIRIMKLCVAAGIKQADFAYLFSAAHCVVLARWKTQEDRPTGKRKNK